MKLTAKAQYAIAIMTYLRSMEAKNGRRPIRVSDISQALMISYEFCEQLFRAMRKAGLVIAVRGPGGGMMLPTDRKVSYLDILKSQEEKIEVSDVLAGRKLADAAYVNLVEIKTATVEQFSTRFI